MTVVFVVLIFPPLDIVLFDRDFYVHGVFNSVDERDLTYITPKKKYVADYDSIEDIKQHPTADMAVQSGVTSSDGDREHELNFIYVPSTEEEGKYAVFTTNKDSDELGDVQSVVNLYRRRWDIENQYKSIKDFLPRTSSMDFRVRYLNFVFATLLYNLWRLTDYLIKRSLDIDIRVEPTFGARTFARVVGEYLRENG